ncbi:MAG: hypothetical protein M3083_08945 [Actinomycetota bacterium]|nr:hypothetical protein [Actinomycetota bacterium]MDQ6947123.1 hypothetical protein [Actinomycetota bacterium]
MCERYALVDPAAFLDEPPMAVAHIVRNGRTAELRSILVGPAMDPAYDGSEVARRLLDQLYDELRRADVAEVVAAATDGGGRFAWFLLRVGFSAVSGEDGSCSAVCFQLNL